ncbi:MAG: alpha/beta fold hydrolase [Candidatus Rokubacteria bacterium]|nr:alpha/beta fold hydrolase [Candidatus Rokubacteria bacterium]
MPIAKVNGVGIYYEEAGRGRPLCWAHGFACGAAMWEPQVPVFADRYRVITFDARGHGASEVPAAPEAYSQPTAVEDLHQLLRHLGIRQACVGGLSMGGNVALNFGLAHPEMVAGLIIADTGAGSDDPAGWRETVTEWAAILEARGIEAFADVMMAHPFLAPYAAQGPGAARRMRSLVTTHRAQGLAHTLRGVLATRPPIYALESRLKALEVPVLVIVGGLDEPCVKVSRYMAETLPRAELVVIRGVGHMATLEDPTTFNGVVDRFLASLWRG